MRNTGVEYGSTDRTPVVLPEMAELLPPLTGEQLAALEADLLKNSCYAPIIVNEDMVIVDGHNRQRLCEKHGIPYKMAVFSFEDLLEAKRWAIENQRGRRNLEKWELGKIALKLRPDIEAKAKENMSAGGQSYRPSEISEEGSATLPNLPPVDTRKELAEAVGLGERTMGKVMQIDEHAPAAVKEALDNGDLSVNQGYNITKQVQELPEEQREEAAAQAVELLKAKKDIQAIDAEADRRGKIAALFCKAFERAVLLTPTEENVRIWVENTRMRPDEIEDSVKEARELAEVFSAIAGILEAMLSVEGRCEDDQPGIDVPSLFPYEDNRGLFEVMEGHQLLNWLTAVRFGAVEWEIVAGTCYERAVLHKVDTSTPEYQAFQCELYRKVLDRMGFGDLLVPEEVVKSQGIEVSAIESQPTELKLYSPLSGELREPEHDEPQALDGNGLAMFQKVILQGIEDERMPEEEERGLMACFDGSSAVNEKVFSLFPTVENMDGMLCGVAVCQLRGKLSPDELAELKEYCAAQYNDAWGESFAQRPRHTEYGDLYVSFHTDSGASILTKEELERASAVISRQMKRGGESR